MLVKIVDTVVATDSAGNPVDAVPVRIAGASETNSAGVPVDIVPAEISDAGAPVRIVAGKTAQNSAGDPVESLPMSGLYEAESLALFARFTTPPTDARKGLINTLIKALKASNVWQNLDVLRVYASADGQAARRNWIQDLYNAAEVASPTFTVDRGYTGDGAAAYLSSGFVPSAAGGKFALNDASLFAWCRTNARFDAQAIIGSSVPGSGYSYINPWNASIDTVSHGLNDSGNNTFAPTSAAGLFTLSRLSSGSYTVNRNSTLLGTQNTSSILLPANELRTLSNQSSFTSRQVAADGWGASLTQQNIADLYAALNAYLTAVGAA